MERRAKGEERNRRRRKRGREKESEEDRKSRVKEGWIDKGMRGKERERKEKTSYSGIKKK